MAACFEKVLTDGWEGIYYESWQIDNTNFPGLDTGPWSITKLSLRGGKQHGVDLVELYNGEMTVVVVPTRGMNVLEAYTEDATLGWDSPVKEIVHPAYIGPDLRGGLGWLEGFSEFVCRCGLESQGAPGEDIIIDNTGNEKRTVLPLHGRISNTPALKVWVTVELEKPHRLAVCGEIYDTRMFGPSYRLLTAISTVPGGTEFTIRDEVENLCGMPVEMELLYHCNYGPPLLEEGSRLLAPVQRMSARDERTLEGAATWDVYGPPQTGIKEECFFFVPHSDDDGLTSVALVNAEGTLGASITYSIEQLPFLCLWKNTASKADGYVTGIEPCTDFPNPRMFERERGRVVKIDAGATYEAQLRFELWRGSDQVNQIRDRVQGIAEGKECHIADGLDPDLTPVQ